MRRRLLSPPTALLVLTLASGAPPATPAKNDAPKKKPSAASASVAPAGSSLTQLVEWSRIAELPAVAGQPKAGLSGSFAGALNDSHLLVAGGSFYGEKGPLDGGEKQFTDSIFVLEAKPAATGDGVTYAWLEQPTKLAKPLAHGVTLPLESGVLCVGGTDGAACSAEVFSLTWDAAEKKVERVDFPPLPKPLAWAGGGVAGTWVVIAGGASAPGAASGTEVLGLDLSQRGNPTAFQWQQLPPLPVAAHFPVCVGLQAASETSFYVFSGRDLTPGQPPRALTDGHRLDLATKTWASCGAIQPAGKSQPCATVAGTAVALEPGRLLVIGGDDADLASFLEANAQRGTSVEEREAWKRFTRAALEAHPGYRREMLLFDPAKSAWSVAGQFPQGVPAAANAFLWDGCLVLAGGEPSPGQRSATVWLGQLKAQ